MTREFLQKYWREIEAFKDGKEVEWKRLDQCGWRWTHNLRDLDVALHELRIKPQPLILYCRLYEDGTYSYPTGDKENVIAHGPFSNSRIVKLIEAPE